MPPEENTSQNPTPDPASLPTSPEPSTEATPEITPISEAPIAPPEAVEAPSEGVTAESNKEAPSKDSEIRLESATEPKSLENQGVVNPALETSNSPMGTAQSEQVPEELKGQTSTNDPLTENSTKPVEPLNPVETTSQSSPQKNLHELRAKEHQAIKNKRNKKLEQILALFAKRTKLTNDEVEKMLHVSDSTATRYLKILVKEGKIKRNGKEKGKYVSYSKI